MNTQINLNQSSRIPMLNVFVADPYYATNAVPSYVCAIDINTCLTEQGSVDLLNNSQSGFVYRMKLAFARGLDISLACLVDFDTRAYIVNHNFFNNGEYCHATANAIILNAINNIAKAIDSQLDLYCNQLSFDIDHAEWADPAPFNLEYRVKWVDAA